MNLKIFLALLLGCIFVVTTAKASQTQVGFQVINTGEFQTGYAQTGVVIITGTINTGDIIETPPRQGYAGGKMPLIISGTGFGSPTSTGDVLTGRIAGPYTSGDLELYSGYKRAFEHGITFRTTFSEKALYGIPTRADLAKMISLFANHALNRPVTALEQCNMSLYKDFSLMTGNESFYIKQACDLGLMGRKNDKSGLVESFNPRDLVTRATVATVLSRLLYGNQYNGDMTADRYSNHLLALHTAGYIHNISDPFAYERYGYVMLMMKRIAEDLKDNL